MKKYVQLTLAQRYEIQVYLKQGKKQNYIAQMLQVSKSSISREIERNSAGGKYDAEEAQKRHNYKKQNRHAYKLTESVKLEIEMGLKADLSPEQIVGKAKLEQKTMVSHETIYRFVYEQQKKQKKQKKEQQQTKEQQQDELCWLTCLRSKQRKRRKRKNINQNRSVLDDLSVKEAKVSIEERPDIINNKERIGDCEIDTIIGKDHKGAILTLVERVTKYSAIIKLPNKSAQAVTDALIDLVPKMPFKVTSITSDNGTEFADYANIKRILDCPFFFAHPYSSWERGLNENTNGLIRQYIPKKSDFDSYDFDYIRNVEIILNNRPRKTLDFYSPVQFLELNNDSLICCT
jgi:transposase, IS30 family